MASRRPANKVSYSAALLVMGNVNLMEHLNSSLSGPMSRILAPTPFYVDDPSTYTDQMSACLSASIDWSLSIGTD